MKRVLFGLVLTAVLLATAAHAQRRVDFSGTWRMDPTRSESAMQGEPIGPVTLVITQTPSEIRIETVTPRTRTVDIYTLNGTDSALSNGSAKARWFGGMLVVDAVRSVRGVSVTTQQTRRMTADGSEMHVDSILEVQHGYTLAKARNYGAGRDVYVRVR